VRFLALPQSPALEFRWFSQRWAHARHVRDFVTSLVNSLPPQPPVPVPPRHGPPPNRTEEMHAEWRASYVPSTDSSHVSCQPPDGNRPPPFIRGILARGSRRLFSAAVQLSTGHAFTSTYSLRFRAGAGDNTSCPCSTPGAPESHTARHVILDCRRHDHIRLQAFGSATPSFRHIFTTFAGGHALGEFLWGSHNLLIPLHPAEPPPEPRFRSPDN
jgi:hypothetical protein